VGCGREEGDITRRGVLPTGRSVLPTGRSVLLVVEK